MSEAPEANPRVIRAIERVMLDAEQRRTFEQALAEAEPMARLERTVRSSNTDRQRTRNLPIMVVGGIGGTAPGADPLGVLIRKADRG